MNVHDVDSDDEEIMLLMQEPDEIPRDPLLDSRKCVRRMEMFLK